METETKEEKLIKILIVDDSAAVRDSLCSILSPHADFKIVGEAVDGLDAIDKANYLHPDVIVIDAQMPGMDGAEATRHIKERFPKIRILLLTVHTSYIEEALAAGADGYLMKDCPREELCRAIKEVGQKVS